MLSVFYFDKRGTSSFKYGAFGVQIVNSLWISKTSLFRDVLVYFSSTSSCYLLIPVVFFRSSVTSLSFGFISTDYFKRVVEYNCSSCASIELFFASSFRIIIFYMRLIQD